MVAKALGMCPGVGVRARARSHADRIPAPDQASAAPCGSDLGRDGFGNAPRRRRSRASALPHGSHPRPIGHRPAPCGSDLGRDGFGNVPRRRRSRASALPRGSQSLRPISRPRSLWERPWSRWLWERPAAPAFARERAPTWIAFPPDRTSPGSLWERPWSRRLWACVPASAFAREHAPTRIASLRPIRHRPLPVGATLVAKALGTSLAAGIRARRPAACRGALAFATRARTRCTMRA